MTERERLIELIEHCSCHYSPPCTGECGECHNVEMYDRNIEHIADHLLANGVIVPLCKVGDKVYSFLNKQVVESVITSWFSCSNGAIDYRAVAQLGDFEVPLGFGKDNIGKTVFLTREEAEKALEGKT